ncbi:MAG: DNA-directed RNA polymerase subunit omega [Flavobacteriales bacterium]|nr:DNA-directed RNA polymerase subunit omega [Flavobacteriales bacterium]
MEYKGLKAQRNTVTRDLRNLENGTGNIFETIAILGKRANQIGTDIKEEINNRMEEFEQPADSLEEIYENREQIEISKQYERMPKPVSYAVQEYLEGKIYHRNPSKEEGAGA